MEKKHTELYCPNCGTELSIETDETLKKEYPYVCLECDENFYSIEAITKEEFLKNKITKEEFLKNKIEKRQNFISVDGKTVRTSYDEFFTIGELVGHEGAKNTATIISFELDIESNEVKAITDKGSAHIDFLIKLGE